MGLRHRAAAAAGRPAPSPGSPGVEEEPTGEGHDEQDDGEVELELLVLVFVGKPAGKHKLGARWLLPVCVLPSRPAQLGKSAALLGTSRRCEGKSLSPGTSERANHAALTLVSRGAPREAGQIGVWSAFFGELMELDGVKALCSAPPCVWGLRAKPGVSPGEEEGAGHDCPSWKSLTWGKLRHSVGGRSERSVPARPRELSRAQGPVLGKEELNRAGTESARGGPRQPRAQGKIYGFLVMRGSQIPPRSTRPP